VSVEENKDLIRRYMEAIDANESNDWSILDEHIAEDSLRTILRSRASRSTVTG
jgi:hypothetical protein